MLELAFKQASSEAWVAVYWIRDLGLVPRTFDNKQVSAFVKW